MKKLLILSLSVLFFNLNANDNNTNANPVNSSQDIVELDQPVDPEILYPECLEQLRSDKSFIENGKYIKLQNQTLQYLDGIHNRLDGNAIHEVIQVRKQIKDLMLNGVVDKKTKDYILYLGKPCPISCLSEYEKKFQAQYKLEKNAQARAKLESNLSELANCLKQGKKSFIKVTINFMRRIEGTKKLVIDIMTESCQRRGNIKNTLLLEWAHTNGNEESVFNEKIRSFAEFKTFLMHTYNFLGDLLKSCEKGFRQYVKLYRK